MKITRGRLKEIIKEEMDRMQEIDSGSAAPDMFGEPDHEGGMARSELLKIAKYGDELRNMLKSEDQLPAWVQSKITKAAAMMGDVKHFIEGEMADQSGEMAPKMQPPTVKGDELEVAGSSLEEMIAEEIRKALSAA